MIPGCQFKGVTMRERGISINLTPFIHLFKHGLTDNYEEMLFAYCILVVMNGWNCI